MTLAFTAEQQDAICAQDRNLLIAAGAGSGKTTVLVERIIRWVEAGGSISRLLALTFTNAAALGMRNRMAALWKHFCKHNPITAICGVS